MQVPQSTQLLALIGLAISTWQQTERSMTELFAIVSDMPSAKAVSLFDGIINFKIRLLILDRMMALEGLSALDMETWLCMSRALRHGYDNRHKLAHFGLVGTPEGIAISPFLTLEKSLAVTREALHEKDIKQRHDEFLGLALSVEWFTSQAILRRPQSQISLRRPVAKHPLIPQLQDRAAQRLAKRRGQQQPDQD